MDWVYQVISAVSVAVGGGGLIAAVLTYRATLKVREEATQLHWDQRNFKEKKEAYLRLLEALKEVIIAPSNESLREYALSQAMIELVGSPSVIRFSRKFKEAPPGSGEQDAAYKKMLNSMRMDMQVDTRIADEK